MQLDISKITQLKHEMEGKFNVAEVREEAQFSKIQEDFNLELGTIKDTIEM